MKILRAEWLATAAAAEGFPEPTVPEVAFLGRSNVGKSSLLNALTSSAPGKTRLIHFFKVERPERETHFVDLPGYGYAKVSKSERKNWQRLIESYLEGRPTLRAAVLLQDMRRDITDDETLLIEWLHERGIPVILAITKIDKLKPMRRAARLRALKATIDLPAANVIATSSEARIGLDELWRAIDTTIDEASVSGDVVE
ncbi:MAG: YihA family ribosome biogenesis GTP-binding protein [Deltaproteobacteria bacterium]|nr:YihA family ribosome biogenesis GTP-binding protein [Deltaproteobacteria bacterium]